MWGLNRFGEHRKAAAKTIEADAFGLYDKGSGEWRNIRFRMATKASKETCREGHQRWLEGSNSNDFVSNENGSLDVPGKMVAMWVSRRERCPPICPSIELLPLLMESKGITPSSGETRQP